MRRFAFWRPTRVLGPPYLISQVAVVCVISADRRIYSAKETGDIGILSKRYYHFNYCVYLLFTIFSTVYLLLYTRAPICQKGYANLQITT